MIYHLLKYNNASERSEREKICADFLSIRFIQPLCSFSPLILSIFSCRTQNLAYTTRIICTFVGVPRTRVRRTEYPLKRSESGVPKRGGIASSSGEKNEGMTCHTMSACRNCSYNPYLSVDGSLSSPKHCFSIKQNLLCHNATSNQLK